MTTSLAALHHATSGGTALPPASPDYWEVREGAATLWGAGATLAGLRAGAERYVPTAPFDPKGRDGWALDL